MPAGRPTVYEDHYPEKAYEFCAIDGFTDKRLAKLFDVDERTINAWKKDHPEFSQSIREGKDAYDCGIAEKNLKRRVTGYRYTETTSELSEFPDPETGKGKMVVIKKVRKHVVPDVRAAEIWLRNRNPKRWPFKDTLAIEGALALNVNEIAESRKKEIEELASLRASKAIEDQRSKGRE